MTNEDTGERQQHYGETAIGLDPFPYKKKSLILLITENIVGSKCKIVTVKIGVLETDRMVKYEEDWAIKTSDLILYRKPCLL